MRLRFLALWLSLHLLTPLPNLAQQAPISGSALTLAQQIESAKALIAQADEALDNERKDQVISFLDQAERIIDTWDYDTVNRIDAQLLVNQIKEINEDLLALDDDRPLKSESLDDSLVSSQRDLSFNLNADIAYDFPIDLNKEVLSWIEVFSTTKKSYVERSLTRATPYMPMILQTFREQGIPEDLAYLALIESGFINSAKSRAAAVGMWQFIRSTGRIYGLKQTKYVDERRDPYKSTRAAALYLKRLYSIMGDWYLATASYNAGPLNLKRAIDEVGTSNFWDLKRSQWLRNETKHYVPKLCAAIIVAKSEKRFNLIYEKQTPLEFKTLNISQSASLSSLSKKLKIPLATIKSLNPELISTKTPPGSYVLRVPTNVQIELLSINPIKSVIPAGTYKIRKGDTIFSISEKFNLEPSQLISINNLKTDSLIVGRSLKVRLSD